VREQVNVVSAASPVPALLIETDMFSDVDDLGALVVAHHFADLQRSRIAAIGVNTASRFGPQVVRVIDRWFGRPGIPVGAVVPSDDAVFERDFARTLVHRHADPDDQAPAESAVRVHRRALVGLSDGEAMVVSIGFLDNLCDLLASPPDDLSAATGAELVAAKVRRTVVMGGMFPSGRSFNFTQSLVAARKFVQTWPTPVDFLGWEVGFGVITGRRASLGPGIVGEAYRLYNGAGTGRASWDLLAMHYAIVGESDLLTRSEPGQVTIDETGLSSFSRREGGSHTHCQLACNPVEAARALDAILDAAPIRSRGGARSDLERK
jgi:hypothetical protein